METKREMKRITAQAFNKKDLMFLWSKKARPFINFLVRHFVTAAAGRFTQWEGRRFGIFHNLGGNAARC